ncbi:hypothetical protein BSL78_23308 [Apostichopus japonicus]|uniref:Uncharacterized protein n=1 Tax=Stichopus japonicus TaxID=307972 RepID=A0A2G8JVT9_STIJA|nr:hypothetical protein BSL78_23308 [Apostichopus japonicus]
MTSFVKKEIHSDEDTDAIAGLKNSGLTIKSGRGVIIKTEPSDTGYGMGDGDENDDEDDSDGEDKDVYRDADEDGLSSMRNGEGGKPLDTAEEDDTSSDDDSTVSVVIKLEPEDGSDESEAELDEDGGAERV